jgi:MoxR-like ATPase
MPDLTIDSLQAALAAERYVADRDLATALYLALALERPLLVEGEAGVGKTEVGRTLAAVLKTELIRLQCYEGLDVNTAVYEWDYPRQMLEIRLLEARGEAKQAATRDIFSEQFLMRRPLLRALENSRAEPPVLLIDEIDRADEEFEAYLLEVLSDFAITVPEIGTIRAARPPRVVITSNRTREVHDALKRRCLYHWIDYPSAERELEILRVRMPGLPDALAREVVAFVQRLRAADLTKVPGIAETIDWAAALGALGVKRLEPEQVERTLGALLKYQEDVGAMRGGGAAKLLDEVRAGMKGGGQAVGRSGGQE